jgi:hypothetical protein
MTPTKDFLTAGCAIFTVEPSDHFREAMAQLGKEFDEHYTYRIETNEERTMFFVQALTGRTTPATPPTSAFSTPSMDQFV